MYVHIHTYINDNFLKLTDTREIGKETINVSVNIE